MFFFFNKEQRELLEKIDSDLEEVIKSVHFSTQKLSSMQTSDKQALVAFIEEASRNKLIKEITVYNKEKQAVASSNPQKIGVKYHLTGKERIIREEFGASIPATKERIQYVINVPIIRDGKPIGGTY
ncbi:MAG: hypothetical protein N2053_10890 [Chitinispirillaceae bacterium]|nr:hypothetical protein [Chitinispirillaceae bacterium]